MSIRDLVEKIKPFYNLLLILIIASIFFALGRLSALEERHTPIKVQYQNNSQTASVIQTTSETKLLNVSLGNESGEVIGSKNGKKYYFPWCGTVKMIKPENQVRFSSIEEARKAGYTPASNCKGLK
ncbi:MAG: hypothetical protein WCW47_00255 [Candidatus Paceibacterota bacterium]|jgi:hypothetical protein